MLMTEGQAMVTWCPLLGYGRAAAHTPGTQRTGEQMASASTRSCIGSRCATWRWKSDQEPDLPFEGRGVMEIDGAPVGYCGMAGHVEVLR